MHENPLLACKDSAGVWISQSWVQLCHPKHLLKLELQFKTLTDPMGTLVCNSRWSHTSAINWVVADITLICVCIIQSSSGVFTILCNSYIVYYCCIQVIALDVTWMLQHWGKSSTKACSDVIMELLQCEGLRMESTFKGMSGVKGAGLT